MVSNEVPHHMHVTCGAQVYKPPVRYFLKCVIGRLTDMKEGLGAHIVLDRLCVLYAREVAAGPPLRDINFYIGPIKGRLDEVLFLAKDGGAVSCVFIQQFPSSVAFNCNKNEWFIRENCQSSHYILQFRSNQLMTFRFLQPFRHLPSLLARATRFEHRSDTGFVIVSEPHLSRTYKASLLFALLAVRVHTGCSAFPFFTQTKPLIRLHILHNCFFFLNKKYLYVLDIYNKM